MYIFQVNKHYKFTHSRRKRQYNYFCVVRENNKVWEWWQTRKPTKNDAIKVLQLDNVFIVAEELKYLERIEP